MILPPTHARIVEGCLRFPTLPGNTHTFCPNKRWHSARFLAGRCPLRLALVETRALPAPRQSCLAKACAVRRTASVSCPPRNQRWQEGFTGIKYVTACAPSFCNLV
jgi:hypothetical protein